MGVGAVRLRHRRVTLTHGLCIQFTGSGGRVSFTHALRVFDRVRLDIRAYLRSQGTPGLQRLHQEHVGIRDAYSRFVVPAVNDLSYDFGRVAPYRHHGLEPSRGHYTRLPLVAHMFTLHAGVLPKRQHSKFGFSSFLFLGLLGADLLRLPRSRHRVVQQLSTRGPFIHDLLVLDHRRRGQVRGHTVHVRHRYSGKVRTLRYGEPHRTGTQFVFGQLVVGVFDLDVAYVQDVGFFLALRSRVPPFFRYYLV